MRRLIGIVAIAFLSFICVLAMEAQPQTQPPTQTFTPPTQLHLTYPPLQHTTTSDRLFFIGTAPKVGNVSINGKLISRSEAGHFAPSLPLKLGENIFQIQYSSPEDGENGSSNRQQLITVKVMRESRITLPPKDIGFIPDSLFPKVNIARQPNERICFEAIATPSAKVVAKIGDREIPMLPRRRNVQLPPNSSVLTDNNKATEESPLGYFRGCASFEKPSKLGQPIYEMRLGDRLIQEKATGNVEILAPQNLQVVEITAIAADARTGASTDFSRLTPLPKGTKALVTGRQGNWLRLDYGGWVRENFTKVEDAEVAPHSIVRSISTKRVISKADQNSVWTEVVIPLEVPVPLSLIQSDRAIALTLYNVTSQTDTIAIAPDSIVNKLDWAQTEPDKITYTINLKPKQQWGYKVRYEGTNLILSLKHPPLLTSNSTPETPQSLQNVKILLDAGHGGKEDLGSRGATGYPEKDVTLITSQLLQSELQKRGATVVMTRKADDDVELATRVNLIEQEEPTLAISIHYNALPDDGDAINTSGVSAFWYNPQAQDFAKFINAYLTKKLNRRDYGVYWNNLALTRPTSTPSVLLELGFMINPVEFEWIIDAQQQKLLASTLADGITEWILNAAN
ncbi:N-acetylmuramoyl-L-alanine amidase [Pseudanabaena sp. FACHB-1998]|uniref:N-acetylmuramoyl-L-alanine amidase n=1 Tax=Pseudanabaena sp. FACHB-1998 TaxID=2692858 RepID=UPI001681153D|nr:N-acetylmuramoyl-L-alanine amidase [Pseudanabaena sp. FACHB-1998]MBD2176734.1 N-acetylmuramoyl-L-alanine amidase [Pseudanabaena sp. FACHB-1998]